MSDSQFLIGKLIIDGNGEPDAVHIATMPVVASESLKSGQHIGFTEGGWQVTGSPKAPFNFVGIVDPFLAKDVAQGERFFMFLYPNTITGLRHVWSHPAVAKDGRGVGTLSEKWLRDFACDVDADYYEMMSTAATHCDPKKEYGGEYLIEGGKWEGQSTPQEFWEHFKNVTGKSPPESKYGTPSIFSCSC